MNSRYLLLIVFALLFSGSVLAAVQQSSMKIFAVTSDGKGLSAELAVTIEPGTGKIWSSIEPLVGTSTQSAERTALDVARIYSEDADSFDYKIEIKSNASTVEGPSAGAAMTLLLVSMLRNKYVPKEVSITGTISSDGSVGPVGGVFEKAQEAGNQGIKLFLVPKGEAKQIVKLPSGVQSVNLIDYAAIQWGLKIVEVENMDQVLALAFSDIQTIDVNQNADDNVFDFLPEAIPHSPSLWQMRAITAKQIEDGKKDVEAAKKALNTSMLEDNELVQILLGSLNNSEETLNEAELLFDKNFLYSAANYAFLAKVNAMLVKDLAENPSLLSMSSTLFHSRLQELKKKITLLEGELSEFIPLDYLEWHIGAQQRVVYAENNIESLLNTQTIVVGTETDKTDYSGVLKRIQDYEFAESWYAIALDFFEVSKQSQRKIKPDNAFKSNVDPLIVQVENGLTLMKKDEAEDITRRYAAAVREKQLGWYLASGFDAASAIALINANTVTQKNDLNALQKTLLDTVNSTKEGIEKSTGDFVWAKIFLDHTQYYISGADYYVSSGKDAKALDSVKSAISIAFLAENYFKIAKDYYSYYGNIPDSKLIKENVTSNGNSKQLSNTMIIVLGAFCLFAGALIGMFIVKRYKVFSKQKASNIKQQIDEVSKMQKALDNDFAKGKISSDQYYSLQEKYSERLQNLQEELKEKSEHFVEIDSLRAKIIGFEHVLRSLKAHYETGNILKEDYERQVLIIQKEIDSVKQEISEEQGELSVEEEKIKSQRIPDFRKEANLLYSKPGTTAKPLQQKKAKWPSKKTVSEKKPVKKAKT